MSDTLQRLNPIELPDAGKIGYSQISIVEPKRLAFVSGQVAWGADGTPTPTTFSEQTALVVRNLERALEAIGSMPHDIVQMRIYVTDLTDETLSEAMKQLTVFLNGARPSLTGVGVAKLASPDLQIEIEMVVQAA
ncbi:RidA family protein [Roseibium alexandrii]|uniref:Putative translation initiation inhibitor, yjgF family n=1 Tax=Roseibium alexandrii (strain DSM 17067 / NCIMB 14079 / DFL-11) TaxID=244592 RepID=A0A5E8GV41_ROSAD|nr:RidA family protein [Roseibium alexandrii]EEE43375.1 putative translation initiation inhibitor, yjgF family [Roseibium alexandrii DFL-11]